MQFSELKYSFPFQSVTTRKSGLISYTDEGKGTETLLFIHGLASYMPAWRKLIPLLKNSYRCLTIDLPGYAKSSGGVHSGAVAYYCDAIKEFIDIVGLTDVTLVGHSMGGQISVAAALQFPDLIKKLILLAPAGFETFTEEEVLLLKGSFTAESFAGANEKQIVSSHMSNFNIAPLDVSEMIFDRIRMTGWKNFRNYAQVVANSLYGLLDAPIFDKLSQLQQETLIIFGRQDRLIPQAQLHPDKTVESIAQAGYQQIKHAELRFIDPCGHFIPYEQPEITAQFIKAFLK